MSVVCAVTLGYTSYVAATTLIGLASAAATALGLRQLNQAEGAIAQEEAREALAQQIAGQARATLEEVELSTAQAAALSGLVAERAQAVFGDARFQLVLTRDLRGLLKVTAHGDGMSRAQVAERAEKFLGLLQQQLAYREVVLQMKDLGLKVEQESRAEDGTVKVRLRRSGG
ncbi:MAG: hypothetical protein ABIO70_15170 [Pseudomonadota bacterium]